jgi:hypothetical protein
VDSKSQALGEKRVREVLIEPLVRLGLAKPSTLTKVQFEAMQKEICAKLAHMTALNLTALADQVAGNPGGKDRDRFPIATTILSWAAQMQPPSDDGSPLVRAVFAASIGQEAIRDGWSPELLFRVKRDRRWPNKFVVSEVMSSGVRNAEKYHELSAAEDRGEPLSDDHLDWLERRRMSLKKCAEIAALAGEG